MTVHPHTEPRDLHVPADPVAGNGTTGPTPVSTRTAFAVLGSMIFLILALAVVLAESTWGHAPSTAQSAPVLYHDRLGAR
jgi:hypothetical protein